MNNPNQVAFGQVGSALASGTTAVTIPPGKVVVAITALTAFKFHTDTAAETGYGSPAQGPTGDTVPEGVTIFGRFSAVRLQNAAERAMVYFG
jgi:hypothetical protein